MQPVSRERIAEAAAVGLVTLHNWAANRRLPSRTYVPVNVAVAAALVGLGRWAGGSWEHLGVGRDGVMAGLRLGMAAAAATSTTIAVAAAVPATRDWFDDDRVSTSTRRAAAYQMAIRIPVGTALAEELAFRGALLGLSLNHRSWLRSIAWTSVLFGVWHVLPTLNTLESNPVGRLAVEAGHHRHAVLFNVAAMTGAGVLFALLRAATGSIVAPVIAHATANAAAYAAARRVRADARLRRVTEIGDVAVEVSHEGA